MRKIRRFWLRGAVFLLILANVVMMINSILDFMRWKRIRRM